MKYVYTIDKSILGTAQNIKEARKGAIKVHRNNKRTVEIYVKKDSRYAYVGRISMNWNGQYVWFNSDGQMWIVYMDGSLGLKDV